MSVYPSEVRHAIEKSQECLQMLVTKIRQSGEDGLREPLRGAVWLRIGKFAHYLEQKVVLLGLLRASP